MVAMGTSLADRAWGAESAVYRVAGVLNVIGGWFFTAIIAFLASALIAYLININVPVMVTILLVIAIILIARNYIAHTKKQKEVNGMTNLLLIFIWLIFISEIEISRRRKYHFKK